MTPDLEFQGKSVEKAVEAACQQLDIKPEKLKYDIVSYGSTGIFGLVGTKKAKIGVYIQEKQTDGKKGALVAGRPVENDYSQPEKSTDPEDATLCGEEAVQKIVDGITEGARVITEEKGKRISYNIEGGNPGVLIGKRGQTLEAIQYIVEKVVNRKSKERVRVSIDVGGYLANKKLNLEKLAEKTAQKAKKNGRPATIGQLNAHDRRIIHLALKNDSEVRTKSVGDGFLRKLVVLPKKSRSSNSRRNYKE
jgi:spoIIIJ-associated protein